MICQLRLQNFKCFAYQILQLKQLTLFSGLNGSGKSSVTWTLVLASKSVFRLFTQGRCYHIEQ